MPTAAITTLRTTIGDILANPGVWSTFSFPPPTILANSVIVSPGDPYLEPSNNSQNSLPALANFRIIITVPMLDNQGNLAGIEEFSRVVFNKLADSTLTFNVGNLSAPAVLPAASGDLLTQDLTISVLSSWS
jgi:hypothetical protein